MEPARLRDADSTGRFPRQGARIAPGVIAADQGVDVHFRFTPLGKDDLPTLLEWLAAPHVARWWSPAATLDEVREEYLPANPPDDAARPFLCWAGTDAIGYVQVYPVAPGPSDWWPDEVGQGVVGIDLLIGPRHAVGRGWGTAMVKQFLSEIMRDPKIVEVRVDPHPDNTAARKCYGRAGFEERGPITTPDGPAILMIYRRSAPSATPSN